MAEGGRPRWSETCRRTRNGDLLILGSERPVPLFRFESFRVGKSGLQASHCDFLPPLPNTLSHAHSHYSHAGLTQFSFARLTQFRLCRRKSLAFDIRSEFRSSGEGLHDPWVLLHRSFVLPSMSGDPGDRDGEWRCACDGRHGLQDGSEAKRKCDSRDSGKRDER